MAPPNSKYAYLPSTRVHVNAGWKWAHEVGTDYWLKPTAGLDQAAAASTALRTSVAGYPLLAVGRTEMVPSLTPEFLATY